jgi:hypothetical protein
MLQQSKPFKRQAQFPTKENMKESRLDKNFKLKKNSASRTHDADHLQEPVEFYLLDYICPLGLSFLSAAI